MSGIKKEIEISAKMNNADFDREIERMQKKIKELYAPADAIRSQASLAGKAQQQGFSGMSAPTQQAMEQSTQKQRRDLDASIREQMSGHQALKKKIEERVSVQEKLVKLSKDENIALEQRIRYQQTLNNLNDNISKESQKLAARGQMLGQTLDARANPPNMPEYRGPGSRAALEAARERDEKDSKMLGGLTGLGIGAAKVYGDLGKLPIEAKQAMGTAVETMMSKQLKEAAGAYGQAFIPERQRAMDAAKRAWQDGRTTDKLVNGILTVATGAALGLAVAGTGGMALPLIGAAATGMGLFSTAKQRAITSGNDKAYEQLSTQDLAHLYEQSKDAEEKADPMKKMAAEFYGERHARNLGMQRQMGLSDQGLSSFFSRGMAPKGKSEFTEEQVVAHQQAIMSAGGSAMMGRNAGFGLGVEKRFDLTNSPQLMGALSHGMSSGGSEEAMVKILEKGVSRGLGSSDLVDVLRSFAQASASIISSSGSRTTEDADRVSGMLSRAMPEQTQAGVEAGKSAMDAYQSASSQTGGVFGVMRTSALMRGKLGGLLSQGEDGQVVAQKLMSIPEAMRTEGHPAVQAAASMLGISPQEAISAMHDVERQSGSVSASYFQHRDKVEAWQKNSGVEVNAENIAKGLVPPSIAQSYRMAGVYATAGGMGPLSGLQSSQAVEAAGRIGMNGAPEEMGPLTSASSEVRRKLAGGESDRSGDQTNANTSAVQQVFFDNFDKFKKELVPVATDIDKVTKQLILLGEAARLFGSKDPGAVQRAANALGTQPQAAANPAKEVGDAGRMGSKW